MGAIGQEHLTASKALAGAYSQLSTTYTQHLERCMHSVEQAHTRAVERHVGVRGLWDALSMAEKQACEVEMVRLETLRRQIQTTLAALR